MQERTLNLTSPFKTSFYYLPGSSPGTTTTMVERIQNGNDILSYTYDDLGNIQSISENGELKVTYYYDELNQLVREDNLYQNQLPMSMTQAGISSGGSTTITVLVTWKQRGNTRAPISIPTQTHGRTS